MSDLNEKLGATEEKDFEGHRLAGPEKLSGKIADVSDVRLAADDAPDFEGHRLAAPEKLGDITDMKA